MPACLYRSSYRVLVGVVVGTVSQLLNTLTKRDKEEESMDSIHNQQVKWVDVWIIYEGRDEGTDNLHRQPLCYGVGKRTKASNKPAGFSKSDKLSPFRHCTGCALPLSCCTGVAMVGPSLSLSCILYPSLSSRVFGCQITPWGLASDAVRR